MDAIPTDAYQWTISFLGRGKLKYTSLLFLGVVGEDVKKHEKVLGGGTSIGMASPRSTE